MIAMVLLNDFSSSVCSSCWRGSVATWKTNCLAKWYPFSVRFETLSSTWILWRELPNGRYFNSLNYERLNGNFLPRPSLTITQHQFPIRPFESIIQFFSFFWLSFRLPLFSSFIGTSSHCLYVTIETVTVIITNTTNRFVYIRYISIILYGSNNYINMSHASNDNDDDNNNNNDTTNINNDNNNNKINNNNNTD